VMAKPFQQFAAIAKEGLRRHAVILEYDAFLLMLKEPIDRRAHTEPATEIAGAEQSLNFALPTDVRSNAPGLFPPLILTISITRPVGRDVKARRNGGADSFHRARCGVRTIEDYKQHRRGCHLRPFKYEANNHCSPPMPKLL